ncbi:MAG: flagellar basal body rod C-terminal domain-containing protein, partial [Gemmatimonadaceae bacterium]
KTKGKEISIDRTGLVTVDGYKCDRLRIESAPPGVTLQHEAGTHFLPDPNKVSVAIEKRDVRQGALEGSNVNTIGSLVDLISISRNFANAQKALTTLDNVRATISNDLGKVPA